MHLWYSKIFVIYFRYLVGSISHNFIVYLVMAPKCQYYKSCTSSTGKIMLKELLRCLFDHYRKIVLKQRTYIFSLSTIHVTYSYDVDELVRLRGSICPSICVSICCLRDDMSPPEEKVAWLGVNSWDRGSRVEGTVMYRTVIVVVATVTTAKV